MKTPGFKRWFQLGACSHPYTWALLLAMAKGRVDAAVQERCVVNRAANKPGGSNGEAVQAPPQLENEAPGFNMST